MRTSTTLFIILLFRCGLCGQSLPLSTLGTAGTNHSNQECTVSWSIGEICVASWTASDPQLHEGFLQNLNLPTRTVDIATPFESICYPNPATSFFHVNILQQGEVDGVAELFDLSGKRIFQKRISSPDTYISLQGLTGGIYLLTIRDQTGRTVSIQKISKSN